MSLWIKISWRSKILLHPPPPPSIGGTVFYFTSQTTPCVRSATLATGDRAVNLADVVVSAKPSTWANRPTWPAPWQVDLSTRQPSCSVYCWRILCLNPHTSRSSLTSNTQGRWGLTYFRYFNNWLYINSIFCIIKFGNLKGFLSVVKNIYLHCFVYSTLYRIHGEEV